MAETTREMVVRLTMDAGGFKKTASEIDRQIRNIDKEIKGMGGDAGKSKLEEKLGLQQKAVENLQKAVDAARTKLQNADTDAQKLLAAKQLSGLETQLATAEAKAQALKNQLSAANLIKFGTLATNFGNHMKSMGRNLTRYVTAPLAALGVGSYKAALNYESAMVSMQKTIDETDTTKYEDIKNAFLEMSETGPVGFTELMELAGMAGAFGVGADDVVKFVESVSMLSVTADDLDAGTGMEGLTKLLNIMEGGDYSNIENTASAVTDLGNNTNATEGEILNMAQKMASAGKLAGMTTEGVLALAAGFVSVGINAEAGGSSVSRLAKMMTSAALSDDANKFSELMGITGKEFASGWRADPANSMIGFFQALAKLDQEKAFGALEWMEENEIKGIRESNLIGSAVTNPNLFRNAYETSLAAYELNAALTEEAEKRYKTGQSYQDTQWNIIQNASAEVGENLVDPFQAVIGKVGELAKAFGELDEGAQNRWIAVAGALIALGPVSSAIGTVAVSVGKIATWTGKLTASGAINFASIKDSILALATNPTVWSLALVGGALWGISNAIGSLDKGTDDIKAKLKSIEFKVDQTTYDETMAAIDEMRAKANMLSGEEGTKNAGISAAVQAGYGTSAMFGQALSYETSKSEQTVAETSGKYSQLISDLNDQIVDAVNASDTSLAEKLEEKRDAVQREWDAAILIERAAYTDIIGKLFAGMIESPELKTSLEQASKDYDLFSAVTNAIEQAELGGDADFGSILTRDVMERFFGNADMRPSYANAVELKEAIGKILAESVKGVEGESVLSALWNAIINDPNASTMIDLTKTQGVFDGWVELMDFSKLGTAAGGAFGTTLTPGLADTITESIPGVSGAMDAMQGQLVAQAAAMGAAVAAAFNSNVKFNIPGTNGGGLNINTGDGANLTGAQLAKIIRDHTTRTARGFGTS